jgi:hypothetical protein
VHRDVLDRVGLGGLLAVTSRVVRRWWRPSDAPGIG